MPRALKVFSTSAGFFDAVVAVPSRKAALEAWGVRDDLFASGAAKLVDDPELVRRALEKPGEIVRVPIASHEGLVAAAKPAKGSRVKTAVEPKTPAKAPPEPPADRSPLDRIEQEIRELEARRDAHAERLQAERAALDAREAREGAELRRALELSRKSLEVARRAYEASGGS